MRIYYVGQLWEGGTCRERMLTLRKLGHEVVPFDTTRWVSGGNRIFRSIAHRVNFGPNIWGMNRALVNHSSSINRVDLIWVDKGEWIYPETLEIILNETQGRLLHYTLDAHFFHSQSRYFKTCIPLYDWVVTTKPFELEIYQEYGAQEIIFVLQGYDPRFTLYKYQAINAMQWSSDVCFVGHYQPHYATQLKLASENVEKFKIWGPGWSRYSKWNKWVRPYLGSNGVWGEDYLHALAGTKIALGLLGRHIPETTTTRSFEIPAIGTFMLAERTDEHLGLFDEGKEAEFFSDEDEMKDKISFYLANERERKKIATAGRERCLRSSYSSLNQLEKVLTRVNIK